MESARIAYLMTMHCRKDMINMTTIPTDENEKIDFGRILLPILGQSFIKVQAIVDQSSIITNRRFYRSLNNYL